MPTDKIIAAYSNWRIIERSYKTYQRVEQFFTHGDLKRKICVSDVPPQIHQSLLESAQTKNSGPSRGVS